MGKIKWFYRRYKAEIKISCIVAGASTAIGIFANAVLQQASARIIIDITLGAIVILLLLGILFNLKILLTNFISKIPHKLVNDKETYLSKDKYWSRLKHFCRFLFYLNDKFLIILNWKRIEIKYCKL